jgi:hypothetical protein
MKMAAFGLLALALATAAPARSEADPVEGAVVLRRAVTVPEEVVPPGGPGPGRCAGRGPRPPRKGDETRVWLTARMARQDAPAVSFVLHLDDAERGRAYVLFHDEKAYAELSYPPKPSALRNRLQEQLSAAGLEDLFDHQVASPLRSAPVTANGVAATEHRLSTRGRHDATSDLTLQLLPDAALGNVAFRLHELRDAFASGRLGSSWSSVGVASGIVIGLRSRSQALGNPANEYEERLVAFERRSLPPETFAVPAGYRKIRFSPDCFVGGYSVDD